MERGRLLLADSHPIMLEGLRRLIEPMYEIVGTANNASALLEAVEALTPDLVVVDLSLPGVEDKGVVRHLKSRYPGLKVLVLSVHDESTVVRQTLASGALGFVLKRSVASDLLPAIQEVLRDQTYISPALGSEEG